MARRSRDDEWRSFEAMAAVTVKPIAPPEDSAPPDEAPVVYRSYDPASLPQSNGHPPNCVCVACLAAARLG